ncbi:MAG: four helix bundle protein [Bacteroidetes bacterium]|nr:four helix bundle protein [Bacteroidota bacterium]
MFVEDFRPLRVYQRAFKAAMRIFEITKGWPKEEHRGILGGLVKMMAHPEQWCGPSSLVREEDAEYDIGV